MLRIVILGGGFAGVEAAQYLDRTVAKKSDVEVTLVSHLALVLQLGHSSSCPYAGNSGFFGKK